MKNLLISWELPIERELGGVLDVTEIAHVAVAGSANGGVDYAPLGNIAPPDLNVAVNDVAFGDWIFRFITVDTNGAQSSGLEVPYTVADDSPPLNVGNVTITPV